jgi:hypothetical protein
VSRIPRPVWVAVVAVWVAAAVFLKWETVNDHAVPAAVWVVASAGLLVYCGFGFVRFLRAFSATDRPPLTLSRDWFLFVVITGSLLGFPVISLVTNDPDADPVAGVLMVLAGLVLVGLFVRYIRKPVLDHGVTLEAFSTDDRRRGRSSKAHYGAAWSVASDPTAVYAVTWVEDTKEICAVRYRRLPGRLRLDPPDPLSNSILSDAGTVEVLGWADDRHALDRALAGWQQHMDGPDSLGWVRSRLAQAAVDTPARIPRT